MFGHFITHYPQHYHSSKGRLRGVVCIGESVVSVLARTPFGLNPALYMTAYKWSQKRLHLLHLYGRFCSASTVTCSGRMGLALFNSSLRKAYKWEIKHNNKSARHCYTSSYFLPSRYDATFPFREKHRYPFYLSRLLCRVQFNYVHFPSELELNG
jgi:hypothetical protein